MKVLRIFLLIAHHVKQKEDATMADIFSAVQVGDEVVCRNCLKMEEMISAQRGITDSYSADDVRETEYTCVRCNKKIERFEIKF
jgi:DNA-directed RNA polymerase subunit RPC12/RpoP